MLIQKSNAWGDFTGIQPVRKSWLTRTPQYQSNGIRAQQSDLATSLSSDQEIHAQRPKFEKPAFVIKNLEVDREGRASAGDHALYEVLLALARSAGLEKSAHFADASDIMRLLKISSIDRLAAALERVSATSVRYFARDHKTRSKIRGYTSLMNFTLISHGTDAELKELGVDVILHGFEKARHIIKYSIAEDLRTIYAQRQREFSWLDLKSILSFRTKYTNPIYQLFAVKAGHSGLFLKPIKIEAQALAKLMGWNHGGQWVLKHFIDRCLNPALQDIEDNVDDFKVLMKSAKISENPVDAKTRQKFARKTESSVVFEFHVQKKDTKYCKLEQLFKKRARLKMKTINGLKLPDFEHFPHELPSINAITIAVQKRLDNRTTDMSADQLARMMSDKYRYWLADFKKESIETKGANDAHIYFHVFENEYGDFVPKEISGAEIWSMLDDSYVGNPDHIFELVMSSAVSWKGYRKNPQPIVMPERAEGLFDETSWHYLRALILAAHDREPGTGVDKKFPEWFFDDWCKISEKRVWEVLFIDPRFEKMKPMTDKALQILQHATLDRKKTTLKTLGYAIWKADDAKFERTVKAVLANGSKIIAERQLLALKV